MMAVIEKKEAMVYLGGGETRLINHQHIADIHMMIESVMLMRDGYAIVRDRKCGI